jgi:hypothetical protein
MGVMSAKPSQSDATSSMVAMLRASVFAVAFLSVIPAGNLLLFSGILGF